MELWELEQFHIEIDYNFTLNKVLRLNIFYLT